MLLDPPEQVDEWRRLVEHALDVMDLRSRLVPSLKGPASKQGKSEVRRYRNALVRLRIAYRRFGPTTRPWFSLLAADTQEAVIGREIARADAWLKVPTRPSGGKDGSRGMAAVTLAHTLLGQRFGFERITTTRGKAYHRLSAILFGDRKADHYEYMRAYLRGLDRNLAENNPGLSIFFVVRF